MIFKELERIYGIEHGGDRKSSTNNSVLKSQLELASQMGISVDTLQNYKMLADMIPELDELVETEPVEYNVIDTEKGVQAVNIKGV